jgi:hypothetical protein
LGKHQTAALIAEFSDRSTPPQTQRS